VEYSKLKGRICAVFGTQIAFADAMGFSSCSISKKLNGRSEWSVGEIRRACDLLNIAPEEIAPYFFSIGENTVEYSELRGRICAVFGTQAAFAESLGISSCSVSKKLNGRSEWTADEIRKTCAILSIAPEEITHYFFWPKS
jgi:DNA-binding transcriptional regulator YdaS (Cro superfamily)